MSSSLIYQNAAYGVRHFGIGNLVILLVAHHVEYFPPIMRLTSWTRKACETEVPQEHPSSREAATIKPWDQAPWTRPQWQEQNKRM